MIEEQVKMENGISDAGKSRYAAGLLPGVFYLYIELPRFDHAVVFTDQEYPAPVSTMQSTPDVRLTAASRGIVRTWNRPRQRRCG